MARRNASAKRYANSISWLISSQDKIKISHISNCVLNDFLGATETNAQIGTLYWVASIKWLAAERRLSSLVRALQGQRLEPGALSFVVQFGELLALQGFNFCVVDSYYSKES